MNKVPDDESIESAAKEDKALAIIREASYALRALNHDEVERVSNERMTHWHARTTIEQRRTMVRINRVIGVLEALEEVFSVYLAGDEAEMML